MKLRSIWDCMINEILAKELTLPNQKLEVARALATGPQVLLLDEVMAD